MISARVFFSGGVFFLFTDTRTTAGGSGTREGEANVRQSWRWITNEIGTPDPK